MGRINHGRKPRTVSVSGLILRFQREKIWGKKLPKFVGSKVVWVDTIYIVRKAVSNELLPFAFIAHITVLNTCLDKNKKITNFFWWDLFFCKVIEFSFGLC